MIKRKCFISFKTQDAEYKKKIHDELDVDMIDKSLHDPINSDDPDYIMRQIRKNYLADSTVTIHLIGTNSAEIIGEKEQHYIKRELQATLYNGEGNTRAGILGVVLPTMYEQIYRGFGICSTCGNSHNYVNITDKTTIKEFSYNYYLPNDKCAWSDEDKYCVLVKWDDFKVDPNKYIELAFAKRNDPITEKIKVYPK